MFLTWLLALLLTIAVFGLIGIARMLGKDAPEAPSRPQGLEGGQAPLDRVPPNGAAEEETRAAA